MDIRISFESPSQRMHRVPLALLDYAMDVAPSTGQAAEIVQAIGVVATGSPKIIKSLQKLFDGSGKVLPCIAMY